jgi:hypothetical protein
MIMDFESVILFIEEQIQKNNTLDYYETTKSIDLTKLEIIEKTLVQSYITFTQNEPKEAIVFLEDFSNKMLENKQQLSIEVIYKIRILKAYYLLFSGQFDEDSLKNANNLLQGAENAKKFKNFTLSDFWEGLHYLTTSMYHIINKNRFAPSDTQMYLEIAYSSFTQFKSKYFLGLTHQWFTTVYFMLGQYKNSIDSLEKAITNFENIKCYDKQIKALSELTAIYANEGNFTKSDNVYQKAMKLLENINEDTLKIGLISNRITYYEKLNNTKEAINKIKLLLDLIPKTDGYEKLRRNTLRRLAQIYQKINQIDLSNEIINELLESDKTDSLSEQKVLIFKLMVENLKLSGDIENAREKGEEFLEMGLETQKPEFIIPFVQILTKIYQELRLTDQLKELLLLSLDYDETSDRYSILIFLGDEYLKEYRLSKTISFYLSAWDVVNEPHQRSVRGVTECGLKLVELFLLQGKFDEAKKYLDLVEKELIISENLTIREKFIETHGDTFERFLEYSIFYNYYNNNARELNKRYSVLTDDLKSTSIASIYYILINANHKNILKEFNEYLNSKVSEPLNTIDEIKEYVLLSVSDRLAEKYSAILPLLKIVNSELNEKPLDIHIHFLGRYVLSIMYEEFLISNLLSRDQILHDYMNLSKNLEHLLDQISAYTYLAELYVSKLKLLDITENYGEFDKIQGKLERLFQIKGEYSYSLPMNEYLDLIKARAQ